MLRKFLLIVAIMVVGVGSAFAADVVAITYYDYPPKMTIVDGRPVGSRIEQMTEIANAAGMQVTWIKASIKQEADMLDAGQRKFCATGRSYSPARSEKWVFLPFYLDALSEHVVVTRIEDAAKIQSLGTVGAILADNSLTGVLLRNYMYGPAVEKVLKTNPSWISREVNMVVQEIDMVRLRRAHYTIVPVQSWRAYQKTHEGAAGLVSLDTFGAMPRDPLYIACSRALEKETVVALEAAMKSLNYRPVDFDKR